MAEKFFDPSEMVRGIQQLLVSDKKRIAFLFGAGTSLAKKQEDSPFIPAISKMTSIVVEHLKADALSGTKYKAALNEILVYGVRFYQRMSNIRERQVNRHPFHGRIWLLTDNRVGSAAALFAEQAKRTGFATLVGEPVLVAITIPTTRRFELPNTGIIVQWDVDYFTDEFGRALEEFPTAPHYFNRDGYDALETALQIINEMNSDR